MLRFLLMRIASAIPVLAILSLVTFAIIQAPPGDYADYIRSQLINQGGASFAEADAQAQAYRVEHGLDKPLPVQYLNWIGGIITRGDFGYSLYYNKPVADVVGERLPRTLLLALVCHLLASVLGITFGIWAATRQYTWIDSTLSAISFLGMTVPRFLMALIIVYLLVFQFNVSEIGSFFSPISALYPKDGIAWAMLKLQSKSVPPTWTPLRARMSPLRSCCLARSGERRAMTKSEVPPPRSTISDNSS